MCTTVKGYSDGDGEGYDNGDSGNDGDSDNDGVGDGNCCCGVVIFVFWYKWLILGSRCSVESVRDSDVVKIRE